MDLRTWYSLFLARTSREEGQTMVEYGLILALIALAVVATIVILGNDLDAKFQDIVSHLT